MSIKKIDASFAFEDARLKGIIFNIYYLVQDKVNSETNTKTQNMIKTMRIEFEDNLRQLKLSFTEEIESLYQMLSDATSAACNANT